MGERHQVHHTATLWIHRASATACPTWRNVPSNRRGTHCLTLKVRCQWHPHSHWRRQRPLLMAHAAWQHSNVNHGTAASTKQRWSSAQPRGIAFLCVSANRTPRRAVERRAPPRCVRCGWVAVASVSSSMMDAAMHTVTASYMTSLTLTQETTLTNERTQVARTQARISPSPSCGIRNVSSSVLDIWSVPLPKAASKSRSRS